ncbi:hypothetical protein [Litoribacter populi]|uniref:hypothetical protein n=1 Tax=Litoribacter populi TaxID=2598460 RepID=UPI001F38DB2C|nr:hypothetical protein [Litoribacter populi]
MKQQLNKWGKSPQAWEILWGDFFRLEIAKAEDVLQAALEIKALIKSIEVATEVNLDVRMAIGVGEKTFSGERISESNGEAFVMGGEKFEKLKKEKIMLGIQTRREDFDQDVNLFLKLASLFMDKWTVSSAKLIGLVLENPKITQEEIGQILGIKQNSVNGRWNRANVDETLIVKQVFRKKILKLIK